jgi:DNA-binding helix-hairpin-helix protein with protein kinase domain
MTVEKALAELNENGFHIVQLKKDEFLVYDTGLFGFIELEDPFVVDGDDLLEIHEQYLG